MRCLLVLFDDAPDEPDAFAQVEEITGVKFEVVRSETPWDSVSRRERLGFVQASAEDYLKTLYGKADLALGVTTADLFFGEVNFVFGLGDASRGCGVVSSYRLEGDPNRLVKEMVHELGHVFGLKHCPDMECVMNFSNSVADVDLKGKTFCANCLKLVQR
jgi:predicted Zn-dependent protease